MNITYLSRRELAERWGVCIKTVDRMRSNGKLTWVNLGSKPGVRPVVRFLLSDIETYEHAVRQSN